MGDERITISLRRDAAHYLFMLLADQLVSFGDTIMTEQTVPILRAYQHVTAEIERALAMPLWPAQVESVKARVPLTVD